ncbi:ABC transporter ATP-binding protein [Lysinibacillus sphaericus]|uniref:ABC transporter ATP-binding protein n=1 Tax=Lysinibacillus sphaericus TaxID=1421 RepID=A0A2S0K5C8_LYSSH|nr:ABC transporter ATP-binding protein [Lysinibacillus sphaericus]AVK98572.1 ABC transporter ATP-binding protein [Lysinibacillus sphaericus]MED4544102.1 ABC transporter ATP-binding protein [Lysinibacillus sphaericus]TKI17348.1 ABC transporter ATP-binding protein [Lysinibacillus sphaericus]SUV15454.1 multidrug ABC transporter ATP-binding protein/permease [Lysinibacillus sphaericus]GEC83158.1 putative ABC transporter ATP-binding protein YfiB [Lysinibacillus sphaericus]
MKVIFSYVKPYKWTAVIALCLMLMELFVELIQPLIMAKIIDDGVRAQNQQMIIQWGAVLLILSFIAFLAGVINSYFSSHTAQSFAFDLRNALFEKIQSFTLATYQKFSTASLITRLTNDVTQVQTVLFMSLRIMLRAPLAVVGSIVMAFVVNAKLALFLVIGAPIIFLFLIFMVAKGVSYFGKVQKRVDRLNRVLQENLQAMRLVKAYLRGKYEASRFEQVASHLKVDTVKALRTMEYIMPVLLFVMNMSLLAVLWFGTKQVATGTAPLGDIVAIVNYAMRITGSFSMFAFIIIFYARAKASAERMTEVLAVDNEVESTSSSIVGASSDLKLGELVFHNVSFQYPGTDATVLSNVSFQVKSGEKLAIMGATGAGKSTLLQLIPRFYDVTEGQIYVEGKDVQQWDLQELRDIIGYVPQQSLLFTGSIADNVRWGDTKAEMDEVLNATMQAQIHASVEDFPSGYDTRVGQKGVNLSGGQKQRLSIARALLRKGHILMLDDSTSALDVKTEQALWDALSEESATMLVVTQKIRTAKGADHILLIDEGKVVAYGSHEDLLQTSELYQKIAISQQEVK